MSLKSIGALSNIFNVLTSDLQNGKNAVVAMQFALQGMKAEQVEAAASALGLNAAQTAVALSAVNMEASEIAAKLAMQGYNKEMVISALTTAGFSEEQIIAAVSTDAFAAAEATATVATNTFAASLANVVKGLVAFLTTNPVGWAILAAGAIFGIVKAYDALTVSAEEATEQMNESFSEFEEATSTLESLNKELETTNERIAELEAKDTLTFVEESELQKLRESVELLQIQADLAEKKAIREGKEAAEDTVTAYRKNFKNEISADAIDEYIANSTSTGNNAILFSDESDISALLAGMEQMKKLRDELDKDSTTYEEDYEHFQGIIDDTTDTIWEQVEVLSDYKSKLESIPYDQLSTDQQNALDEINSAIELIYTSLDPGKWKEMQWNGIVNNEQYADDVKKLKELAATTEITASTIRSEFPEVAQACEDAGLKISDVADNLNASFERATDEIGNKKIRILSSLFDMPDVDFKSGNLVQNLFSFGADVAKQYQEYAEYLESLSDEDIELAYNIVVTSNIEGLDELKTAIEAAGIEDVVSQDKLDEYKELYDEYQKVINETKMLGVDLAQTTYGNIDLNNRAVVEWTEELAGQYKSAIESWGDTTDDYVGYISTVLGSLGEFDGIPVAFSPMLQTDDGAVLLDANTVDKYINAVIKKAKESGDNWSFDDVFRFDAEGLEIDGRHIQGLIADIGDSAEYTSRIMHYIGTDGSVNSLYDGLAESAEEAGVSIEALMYYFEHSGRGIAVQAENIRTSLKGLWSSEDFEDTQKSLMAMSKTVDGITGENIKELATESVALKSILDQDGMSAEFLANVLQNVAEGKDGFALVTDSALILNDALQGLRGQFDEITKAKSRYDAAMKAPEKDADFKSYVEAFEALNEQFVAGTTNSNAFWAAAEYLFGEDQLQEWGWSDGLDKIYEAMKKNVSIFKDADSAGSGFLDKLYAMSEAGEIKADDGSVIAEIKKLSDGSYDFQFDSANLDALADKLGITSEAALACMEALSMYGDFNFYDIDAVMKAVEEIGLASDSLEGTAVNVDTLTDQLITLGYTKKDIHDLLNVLSEVDGVTLLDANANIETLTKSLSDLGLAAQNGVEVTVNADGLAELMSQLNFTKDDAQKLITKLDEADNVKLTNAQGEVVTLQDALKKTDELEFANVTSELDGITNSADLAQKAVDDLQKSINTLKSKTITVTVDVKKKNGILGNFFGYDEFAKGTSNAPEGDALVGEKGEELVQSGDRAYLVGTNGPEITHLNEGDIVYTAEQTKKIKRGSTVIKGVIPAYAGGTINPNKGSKKGYKSVLPSSKKSTASEIKEAAEATKSLEEQLEDTLKGMKETIDDIIGDYEHSIMILEHKKADPSEIINIYKQMQEAVHQQAEDYRALGLDENSDYIQELQKQWWEYQDSIQDLIIETYEKSVAEHENAITLNENWLDKAITKKDFSGITKYTSDIINHYKAMQDEIHQQAEYYRSLGYSDTSDEVSKLSDLWWDYYDKIAETSANAWQQVVDNANDAVDEITGLYDTLKDAAQEYADSGFITIDTLQEICSWGIQYLAYLKDENGQLVINEESLQKVIAARTEQMAVETALSYVQQIRSAIERNEINELMNLTLATEQTTTATWDLVYAQLRLLNVSGDLNDTMYAGALQNINNLRALSGIAISSIGKVEGSVKEANESAKKALKEQGDYLDDLLKYVMEMIKQEVKNQIDALENQIDKMKDIVDLQKKSLDLEREKDKYTKTVAEKTKELAKLQQQLALLELDDSRESAAKQAKLKEEIADLSNDLADDQADHAYDATSDMLDDMYDAYEKEKKKEIETLENTISSEEKVYRLAIERIQTQWDTLYQQLLDWNYEYGTVTNNEITAAWDAACAAVQKYGSYLEAVLQTQQQLAALEASSSSSSSSTIIGGGLTGTTGTPNVIGNSGNYDTSGGQETENAHNIIKRMYTNSQAWASSSPEKRKAMHEENKSLAAQLSRYGIVAVTDGSSWFVDRIGGQLLYDKYRKYTYHNGGIVGDNPTLKQDEVFAKLKKGEAVFTEEQQKPIYQVLEFAETMLGKYGKMLSSISDTDLMGVRMQEQIKQDTQQAQMVVENGGMSNEFNLTFPMQVLQKLDDAEIQALTSKISKYTINELDEVFGLRGKRSFRR